MLSKIHSDKVEQIALDNLKPSPRNARTHSKKQIAQITKSLDAFGFTNPLLIDDQNIILAGHGRLAAARKLDLKAVELDDNTIRWRKTDLDRLVRRLPIKNQFFAENKSQNRISPELDEIRSILEKIVSGTGTTQSKLVSISEASNLLGVGRSTIYRQMESGALGKRKIGSRTLIVRSDIDRILS